MKSDKKGSCGKQPRVGKVGDKKPGAGMGRGIRRIGKGKK